MAPSTRQPQDDSGDPLGTFSRCHAGIVTQLEALGQLPDLLKAAAQARAIAASTLALFREGVMEHHADEERELFPAVLRSAHPGEEREAIRFMVERLTREHREIEAIWKTLEPGVRAAAKGGSEGLDVSATAELIYHYLRHARFEEQEFLPRAATILGRDGNHMAALGLSLHLRHAPQPPAYM